jgi:hypothetical protein
VKSLEINFATPIFERFFERFWCLIHNAYFTKLCVFNKRKFPKLTSKTQVSFVNEAPAVLDKTKIKFFTRRLKVDSFIGKKYVILKLTVINPVLAGLLNYHYLHCVIKKNTLK